MITAILSLAVLGVIAGAALGIASKKFFVPKEPKLNAVLEELPGINCGACGYPGCAGLAQAIVEKGVTPSTCSVVDAKALETIAKIMGISVSISTKKVARLRCGGDKEASPSCAVYNDIEDCFVMNTVSGGGKRCIYGCMGGGSCVKACNYGAMKMGENGLPEIIEENCISCGKCVKACPRNLIKLIEIDKPVVVTCMSNDKGAVVRKICSKGCIGCGLCVKNCPSEAIVLENFLAVIVPEKCTLCGKCIEVCPTKAIITHK